MSCFTCRGNVLVLANPDWQGQFRQEGDGVGMFKRRKVMMLLIKSSRQSNNSFFFKDQTWPIRKQRISHQKTISIIFLSLRWTRRILPVLCPSTRSASHWQWRWRHLEHNHEISTDHPLSHLSSLRSPRPARSQPRRPGSDGGRGFYLENNFGIYCTDFLSHLKV